MNSTEDDRPSHKGAIREFVSYVRPHTSLVAGAMLAGVGKYTLPLLFPLAVKYVVDVLLTPNARPEHLNLTIDRWCAWLGGLMHLGVDARGKLLALTLVSMLVYVVQSIASYYRAYWGGVAGSRLIFDLRRRVYAHLQNLSHSFFDRNPSGAIISRVVNDTQIAQDLVATAITELPIQAVYFGLALFILFGLDVRLALISIAIGPIYVALLRYFSPRIKSVSHGVQQVVEEVSATVQERVAGAATVKSFGREEEEVRRFTQRTEHLHQRTVDKLQLGAAQQLATQLLTRTAPSVVVCAGALMILDGKMTLGTMVAFVSLLGHLYVPLETFADLSTVTASSLAAIERIFSLLAMKPDVADHPLSRPFQVKHGSVQFENVNFNYVSDDRRPLRPVLRDLSLHIPGGTTVALVGRSGAGKTTLASLLPRFYDATSGRVLIDGKDVKHYTLKSLRDRIGIVTQDVVLFSASVRDNLKYGRPDADDDLLWWALEQANLRPFVEKLPDGLDTMIGERGVKLSGGQRQRLAVARAFLKDPAILILDEATSAVDSESENLIHEAMHRLMAGRTSLLIAHRLRSAIDADMIIALDDGMVAEVGTHESLLVRGGLYAKLFHEQMRGLSLQTPRRASHGEGASQQTA